MPMQGFACNACRSAPLMQPLRCPCRVSPVMYAGPLPGPGFPFGSYSLRRLPTATVGGIRTPAAEPHLYGFHHTDCCFLRRSWENWVCFHMCKHRKLSVLQCSAGWGLHMTVYVVAWEWHSSTNGNRLSLGSKTHDECSHLFWSAWCSSSIPGMFCQWMQATASFRSTIDSIGN